MAKITTITVTNGTTYDIGAKYDSDGNQISSTYLKGTEAGKLVPYGYCQTGTDTVAKVVTVSPSVTELTTGLIIAVKFQYANTGSNPTLNVNGLGAKAIKRYGTTEAGTSAAANWNANSVMMLTYDGTYWMLNDWNNTTYSGMSDAEYQAGTSTTNRLITPARLKAAIELHAPVTSVNGETGDVTLTASDVGAVPTTRTVNGKALSANISLSASDVSAIPSSQKGAASGVAELDSSGKVPTSQLPSYVDDVLEYTNKASFPTTGETGKIYVDKTTNITYRWSGTAYVEISPSLALGETSSTAYRGDYGAAAYAHAVTNKGSAFTSGLYKITTNSEGHVTAATAVQKSDITGLGIPGTDTNTTYTAQTTSIGSASTGTAISADDITGWTANTVTSASVTAGVFKIATGTAASLSYTSRSIPNISVTATTVATGITANS